MNQLKNPDLVGEAVNDVMLAIWQHAGDFDPAKGKFTTWLFGIANNKGLKIRERSRRFTAEQPFEHSITDADAALDNGWEQLDPSQTPEQTILGWEVLDMLKSALELLSSDHREILELSYGGEHSYQEIADLLGCPANTVKTRVFHARKKLFMHLQRKGYAPATFQQES
jgi:RNA polymerase sigma-70 factor (ECF subfamily)